MKLLQKFLPLILTLLVGLRIFFLGQNLGVEFDNGWYLSMARTIAETGNYATTFNNSVSSDPNNHQSIYGRVNVQDAKGYTHYPGGVTVGPAGLVPMAFMIKIFGFHPLSYRAFHFCSFLILFYITLVFLFSVTGIVGMLGWFCWAWMVPQFYSVYALEFLSETVALFYIALGLLAFPKRKLLAGLCVALATYTKLLSLLALPPLLLPDLFNKRWKNAFLLSLGFIAGVSFFELYQLLYMVLRFDWKSYLITKQDWLLVLKTGGGMPQGFSFGKWNIWMDLGFRESTPIWLFLIASLIWLLAKKNTRNHFIFQILFAYFTLYALWFLFSCSSGWGRHAYGMLATGSVLLAWGLASMPRLARIGLCFVLVYFLNTATLFIPFDLNPMIERYTQVRFQRGIEGFPPNTFLRAPQDQFVEWLEKNIPRSASIYYVDYYGVAEVSALTGRIFRPLIQTFSRNKSIGGDYLISGPYQAINYPGHIAVSLHYRERCSEEVFRNDYYTLCRLF